MLRNYKEFEKSKLNFYHVDRAFSKKCLTQDSGQSTIKLSMRRIMMFWSRKGEYADEMGKISD